MNTSAKPRRYLRALLTGVLASTLAAGLVACGDAAEARRDGTLFVVATATANEPLPVLPDSLSGVLKTAVEAGEGLLTVLIPQDDGSVAAAGSPIDIVVKRGDDVENDAGEIAKGLAPIRAAVDERLASAASNSTSLDLLSGLNDAARRSSDSTIVAISSGLQTEGLADFAGLGWEFDNADVIGQLSEAGFLPDLSGRRVYFSGLGEVAGKQEVLPEPMIRKVTSFWLDLCNAAKANSCDVVAGPANAGATGSTTPAKLVPVPVFALPPLNNGIDELRLDSQALFGPDSADLRPEATAQMGTLAAHLNNQGKAITITGHAWKWGPADSARDLSQRRAQAVAHALTSSGLRPELITQVRGVGYDQLITPAGADEDATAAANRVVVVDLAR
ncbi:OmpA family protein [Gordonia phosphorivorans]|uniref:OmpA family protein n=1 Tax=Gordonia phosphorivorans TaxID=1056982 RepID=A0ABV6HAZ0_9ACTN